MNLIFTTGHLLRRLAKCSVLENMRFEISKKIEEGVFFSNEATTALSIFPTSEISVYFAPLYDELFDKIKIEKFVLPNEATNKKFKNAGFSLVEFLNAQIDESNLDSEPICYHIPNTYCEKIGWTNPNIVPSFVNEVFEKLDCMPDEITH